MSLQQRDFTQEIIINILRELDKPPSPPLPGSPVGGFINQINVFYQNE